MHPYLLPVSVLCVAPAVAAQGAVCTDLPEVQEHLLAGARRLEPELHLRVVPALQPALQKYLFCITSQFCFKFRMRQMPDGELILTPQYADDWRIIQCLTHPQAGIRLTEREEKTLAEARRRVAALVKPGMSRAAVVKALHDDLVGRMHYKPSRWMGGAAAALLEDEAVRDLGQIENILFLQQPDGAPWQVLLHEPAMIREVLFEMPEAEFRALLANNGVILPGEPGFVMP